VDDGSYSSNRTPGARSRGVWGFRLTAWQNGAAFYH
jgi:hypothetical protein